MTAFDGHALMAELMFVENNGYEKATIPVTGSLSRDMLAYRLAAKLLSC